MLSSLYIVLFLPLVFAGLSCALETVTDLLLCFPVLPWYLLWLCVCPCCSFCSWSSVILLIFTCNVFFSCSSVSFLVLYSRYCFDLILLVQSYIFPLLICFNCLVFHFFFFLLFFPFYYIMLFVLVLCWVVVVLWSLSGFLCVCAVFSLQSCSTSLTPVSQILRLRYVCSRSSIIDALLEVKNKVL